MSLHGCGVYRMLSLSVPAPSVSEWVRCRNVGRGMEKFQRRSDERKSETDTSKRVARQGEGEREKESE